MATNAPGPRIETETFHLNFEDPLPGTEEGEVEYEITPDHWERTRERANGCQQQLAEYEAVEREAD
jgi:hypothetical protein